MRRGEIWWADLLLPPAGRRPVVLLSRDEAYAVRAMVVVAPITTRIRGVRAEVELGQEEGLPQRCVANLDTITTIPKARLRERVTSLSAERVRRVEDALHFALGLECPRTGREA